MSAKATSGMSVRALRDFGELLHSSSFRVALALSLIIHLVLLVAVGRGVLEGPDGSDRKPAMMRVRLLPPEPPPVVIPAPIPAEPPVRQPRREQPARLDAAAPPAPPAPPAALPSPEPQTPSEQPAPPMLPAPPATTMAPDSPAQSTVPNPAPVQAAGAAALEGAQDPRPGDAPAALELPAAPAPSATPVRLVSPAAEPDTRASAEGAQGAGTASGSSVPATGRDEASGAAAAGRERDGSSAAVVAGSAGTAAAPSGGGAGPRELASVRRRIDAHKVYPQIAVRNGWEGRVLVEMHLEGDGRLAAVRLLEGSGFAVLDDATISAVRRASPFPPIARVLTVPVEYRLIP